MKKWLWKVMEPSKQEKANFRAYVEEKEKQEEEIHKNQMNIFDFLERR